MHVLSPREAKALKGHYSASALEAHIAQVNVALVNNGSFDSSENPWKITAFRSVPAIPVAVAEFLAARFRDAGWGVEVEEWDFYQPRVPHEHYDEDRGYYGGQPEIRYRAAHLRVTAT